MDFEKRISDYGMTPEQYEASFAEITAKVQGNSDKDWTEIIDQYSIPLSRNTLRNACSNVYGSVFVKEYFDEKRRKEMEVNSEPTTDEPAPLSLPRYKEQTDVNKDGSFTSDRLIEINEENLKNPEFLLNAHGYDPLEWELVSARNSIWNQGGKSGVKNLYASKINVKPRTEISITLNKIEEFFNRLDRNYSKPKILKNNFYLDGDKLLLIDIADLHMNLQATLFSTNNEYNCEIAEKLFFYVIEDILSRTEKYNFKEIIFCIGGDMLNGDNLSGTTTKGTPQNSDIHYYDAYEKLCSMVIKAIDILKVFFLVSHDEDTHGTSITQFQGNSILLYFIQQDGDYVTDKYVTEKWVNDQNFMSADSAKQFIQEQLELTVSELVDKKIDEALDKKIGGLESTDIANIFN